MKTNFPFKVGDKVTLKEWDKTSWVKILFIGEMLFLGVDKEKIESTWLKDGGSDWQLYEEPKEKKLVSPAIINFTNHSIIQDLQPDIKPARVVLKNVLLINEHGDGYNHHDIEADLFFEVETE